MSYELPEFFRDVEGSLNKVAKSVQQDIIASGVQSARARGLQATARDNGFTVYGGGPSRMIDMKDYFKNSAKAKSKKNGGWYLVIPLRPKAKSVPKELPVIIQPTRSFDELLKGAAAPNLLSNPVTKQTHEEATGKPVFRTVSDRSKPDSWLVPVGGSSVSAADILKTMQSKLDGTR